MNLTTLQVPCQPTGHQGSTQKDNKTFYLLLLTEKHALMTTSDLWFSGLRFIQAS
jgi:hypothetical protein